MRPLRSSRVLCEQILSLLRFRLEHCWSLWGGRSADADEKEVHRRAAARGRGQVCDGGAEEHQEGVPGVGSELAGGHMQVSVFWLQLFILGVVSGKL